MALDRLEAISRELETLSARRSELWEAAAQGIPDLASSIAELSEQIDELWETYRRLRSVARNGTPEQIRNRARREQLLRSDVRTRG
jgi:hypothetical protein